MFIELIKNNGIDYLRLVSSRRITDVHGNRVARKRVVLNIGPLSRFDDGEPDYLLRLRASFRDGHPLIDSLFSYVPSFYHPTSHALDFRIGTADCVAHPRFFSSCLLNRLFTDLGLSSFFASLKHEGNISYELSGFVRLLVYDRILGSSSADAPVPQGQAYMPPLVKHDSAHRIYDTLDILYENRTKIIRRMTSSARNRLDLCLPAMLEEQAALIKNLFPVRPNYIKKREHFESYLLTGIIAFTMIFIILRKLHQYFGICGWTPERVCRCLRKWKVESLPDEYYRFCDIDDPDLEMILEAFDIHIIPKLYSRGELRKIK